VAPPPVDSSQPQDATQEASNDPLPPEAPNEKPHHPAAHQPREGSTLAIVATVIIVIALALLATYAFLKINSK